MNILLVITIGVIAGFLGGSLGVSSAPFILPPLLLFSLVDSYKSGIGTVILTIIPPLSIFALYNYYYAGYVKVKLALLLMVAVIIGGFFGSKFTMGVSPTTLAYMTSGSLFSLSLFWFYLASTGKYIMSGTGRDVGAM
tara:strand:+ start:422 stop:835 length:414 start_codon:yes stop_codon:yes gene_type:complete